MRISAEILFFTCTTSYCIDWNSPLARLIILWFSVRIRAAPLTCCEARRNMRDLIRFLGGFFRGWRRILGLMTIVWAGLPALALIQEVYEPGELGQIGYI